MCKDEALEIGVVAEQVGGEVEEVVLVEVQVLEAVEGVEGWYWLAKIHFERFLLYCKTRF